YKTPEATAAAFEDGRFKTGDIGEFLPGGHLRITDRKKDLIKTAGGKFVAPQKIESLLRSFPLLGPALIHGDKRKYIVALLTLDPQNAKAFAAAAGLGEIKISELIKNEKLQNEVRTIIAKVNSRLAGYESIKRYKILPDEFTIAGGELTPSLKVRRKLLEQRYASELDSLYS
ncbi:MAG: AMP-binding protein, partial [Bdellovibrionaceae bacterium]|nr:AMP-binding protein [Pseudobdellovibrionaceae bacterium]